MSMSPLRRLAFLAAIAVTTFMVGCAGPAPHFQPSIDNVELLKKSGAAPLRVGQFGVTSGAPGADKLQIRANTMMSPVGTHYGDYLADALRKELELAKLSNPQSGIEVSGTLVRNNIDAGGLSVNTAQVEARFVVKRDHQPRFDKVKKADLQWESSFAGAVAIPLAANNYATLIQKLLSSLYIDPDFVAAVRP